ncbi:MAG TPA: hypothetical protein VGS80_12980, partial [Ktedonobacterales bacterium]|nr:hypothetical protein [Ktedonobacterales bacterium]
MRSTPDAGKEVGHGPLAGFRSKLIDFRTMPPALRIMSVAAILALVGTGASLVLIQVHQPRVQTALNVNGQATDVPLVALLMLAVVGGLGYTYALAGAMQMRWHLRLFVVALVTLGLGFIPTLYLLSSLDFTDSLLAAQTALHVGQIIVLALIWVWAIGIALFRRQEPAGVPPRRHYAAAFAAALGLIAACYGLSLAIWLVYRGSGARLAAFGDVFLTDEIVAPIYVFPFILPLFIYWASTDTVEWSTTLAGTIAERIRRLPWLLPALAALAAVALVVYDMLTSHSGLLPALVVAALLAGGAVLVLGLGAAPDDWPAQVPVTALLAGVVFLFAAIDLPSLLLGLLAAVGWPRQAMVTPLSGAATLVVDTLGIAGGLALAALGRLRRRGVLTIIGLLLALEAGLTLASELDIVQARIGVMLIPQPKHILVGIELGAALSTLAVIGVLALRRQALAQWAAPLTGALIALGGLVAIDAANTYALARLNVTSRAASVIALVFLATVLWDVATSGQQVTNRDSAAAPRPGRVLLYFGYSLIAAALFLYAAALRIQGTNAPIPQYLVGEDGATAIAGLYLLGIPLALTIGIAHGWRGLTLPRREQTG